LAYFWSKKIVFLVEWYRHTCGFGVSVPALDHYAELLLSLTFRMRKLAKWASGTWRNATSEVYHHLMKLLALGASYQRIIASPSQQHLAFPVEVMISLVQLRFFSYSAWIFHGKFDYGDSEDSQACPPFYPPLLKYMYSIPDKMCF
jgi:hypothetical protein